MGVGSKRFAADTMGLLETALDQISIHSNTYKNSCLVNTHVRSRKVVRGLGVALVSLCNAFVPGFISFVAWSVGAYRWLRPFFGLVLIAYRRLGPATAFCFMLRLATLEVAS